MNLVEQIKNQLSSEVINYLSSQVGATEGATRSAVLAAVPALLSALSSVASSGNSGSQKVISALEHFSAGSLEDLGHKLSNQPDSVLEQGASILSALFGNSTISGIVSALCKFASVSPGAAQKLLGFVTPLIMKSIAGQFAGKATTPQALSSLFADQKANIASALPSGFSLSDVPGLAAVGSAAARSAVREVEAAGSSLTRWLLPLLGIAALGLLVWWFVPSSSSPPPEAQVPVVARAQSPDPSRRTVPEAVKIQAPDLTKFSTELTETFSKLTEAFTSVKDAASAEATLPKLQDLEGKLDVAKTTIKDLGDAGKTTIKTLVTSAQAKLRELVDKVLQIPGAGEKIKKVADSIMAKLTDLAG
jgi:Bacterial protein of unknown function (DUF937)